MGCSGSTAEPPTAAPPAVGAQGGAGPTARYLGPERLTRPGELRAAAKASSGRVVAVTFLLDAKPLGSDATAPFAFDVDPALLPPGEHRIRVEAVDNLGRRSISRAKPLTVAPFGSDVVEARPGASFERAREELRAGGVTVRLAPGRYEVDQLRLGSGARLVGSGPSTVIAPTTGARYWALIVAKGERIRISDLAVDGGGPKPGSDRRGIAIAVFDGSRDVRLQRLRLERIRTLGVNVWGAHSDVSVQDSQLSSDGSAQAGVFVLGSDRSRDTSAIRNRIRGFRSYGILLGQKEFGRPAAALHGLALDNDVRDIRDPARDACVYDTRGTPGCGTNEGGIWTGGVEAAIIGNTVHRARWDGIETVGSSTRTTVVGNRITTTRTGIYLEHSTNHSLIARNLIADAEAGIQVEWRYGGQGSSDNTFAFNRLVGMRKAGIFVDTGGDRNVIVGNVFVAGARPAITLQGSSRNLVQGNVDCRGGDKPLVTLQSARWDDGSRALPSKNLLRPNRSASSC